MSCVCRYARPLFGVVGAAVLASACFVTLALAAEGDLDPSFNGGQPVVVSAGPSGSQTKLTGVAKQADSKVVVVGNTDSGNGSGLGMWVIERFLANGQLDSGFGSGGVVSLNLGGVSIATAVLVQPADQRILVGGEVYSGGTFGAEFVRLNADGSLDTSFGGTGKVFLSRSGTSVISTEGLALDSSGNAYLAGGGLQASTSVGVLASVTSTGAANGWATGGILVPNTSSAGPAAQLSGVAVSGGTVFFAGSASDSSMNSYALIGAVNGSDGSAVSAFGTGGLFKLSQGTTFNGLLLAADGKLKATGFGVGAGPGTGALIASFNTTGSNPTDTSFGSGGQVIVGGAANQPNNGNAITEENGKLFVAATAVLADSSTQVSLIGADEKTGALDAGLGAGGFKLYSFGAQSYSTAIADLPNLVEIAGVIQQTLNGTDLGVLGEIQTVAAGGTSGCKPDISLKITKIRSETDNGPRGNTLLRHEGNAVFTGHATSVYGWINGRFSVTNNNCQTVTARIVGNLVQNGYSVKSSNFDDRYGDCGFGLSGYQWHCTLAPGETKSAPFLFEAWDKLAVGEVQLVLTAVPWDATPDDNVATAIVKVIPWSRSSINPLPAAEPASRFKAVSGSAGPNGHAGKATVASADPARVTEIQVAIVRTSGGCHWLTSTRGRFRSAPRTKGTCLKGPVWLRAEGTSRWILRLTRSLPRGTYTIYSRATDGIGLSEGLWGAGRSDTARIRLT